MFFKKSKFIFSRESVKVEKESFFQKFTKRFTSINHLSNIVIVGISSIVGITFAFNSHINIFVPDYDAPVLNIRGGETEYVLIDHQFEDPGVTCTDEGDGFCDVEVDTSQLNTSVIGDYNVYYSATDVSGNEANFTREIRVVEGPRVEGINDGDKVTEDVTITYLFGDAKLNGETYKSGTTISKSGIYVFEIQASTIYIKMTFIIDRAAPEITLNSNNQYVIAQHGSVPDFTTYFNIYDGIDGDITVQNEMITHNVDTAIVGIYNVNITAYDSTGNASTKTIQVEVTDRPIIYGVNDGESYDHSVTITYNYGRATLNGSNISYGHQITTSGVYTLRVESLDGSLHTTYTFIVDVVAPTITDNNLTYRFIEGTALPDFTSYFNVIDDIDGNINVTNVHITHNINNMVPGTYTLTITVSDAVGNTSVRNKTIYIDETPSIDNLTNNQSFNSNITLDSYYFTNMDVLLVNGSPVSFGTVLSSTNTYVIEARNTYHNVTRTVTIHLDKVNPTFTSSQVNGRYYSTNQTVNIFDNIAINNATYTLNGINQGSFNNGDTFSLEGNYVFTISDTAGNITTLSFGIDKTSPTYSNVTDGSTYNSSRNISFSDNISFDYFSYRIDSGSYIDEYSSSFNFTANGLYTVLIYDGAGNQETLTFRIDNINPVFDGASPSNNTYHSSNQTINVSDNHLIDIISYTLNGTYVGTVTDGFVTTTDGVYVFTARDVAGNQTTLTFTIDRTNPTFDSSQSNNNFYNTNQTVLFSDATSSVTGTYTLDGSNMGSFTSGTTFSTEGEYVFTIVDSLGNSRQLTFTIDKTNPIISNASNGGIYDSYFNIEFSDLNTIQSATVQINSGAINNLVNSQYLNVDGNYQVVITDIAGNTTTINFTIDTVNPTFTIPYSNNDYVNSNLTINYNDLHTAVSGMYTLNGSNMGMFSNGQSFTSNGVYVFTISDQAGNTTEITITIDKIAPTTGGYTDGGFYKDPVTVTFGDNNSVVTSRYKIGAGSYSNFDTGDIFSAEGVYTIEITDIAGNVITETFTIDKTAPTFTSGQSNGSYYNSLQNVCFTDGSGILTSEYRYNSGSYTSFNCSTNFNNTGLYEFIITDLAGNTETLSFYIDKVAPTTGGYTDGGFYKDPVTVTFGDNNSVVTARYKIGAGSYSNFDTGDIFSVEGVYTIEITDIAGNVITETFTIDKTAPTFTSGQSNGSYYNSLQNVCFTDGSGILTSEYRYNSGSYTSFNCSTNFNNTGLYEFIITDLAGNTETLSFYIDKVAPTTGGYTDGGFYKDTVTVTFGDNNSVVTARYKIGAGSYLNFDTGDIFSAEGVYTIEITDIAGNVITETFTIDKTAPTFTSGQSNGSYYNSLQNVCFTDGSGILTSEYRYNSGSYTSFNCSTNFNDTGLYEFIITDLAGNTETLSFYIDKVAPTTGGYTDGGFYKDTVTVTFGDNNSVVTARYKIGAGSYLNFDTGDIFSAEGVYTIEITDIAGNVITETFTIDKTAPTFTSGQSNNDIYKDNQSVCYSDNINVVTSEYQLGSGPWTSFNCATVFSTQGDYNFRIRDAAGNESTLSFTIDKTAPTIGTSGASTNLRIGDAKPDFRTYFTILDNEDGPISVTYGMISESVNMNVADTYSVVLTVTDSAGNTSTKTINVTVDYIPQDESCFTLSGNKITSYDIATCGSDLIFPNRIGGHTIMEIDKNALQGIGLTSVRFLSDSSVTKIDEYAFADNNITAVYLPDSIRVIEKYAFKNNNISILDLGQGVQQIKEEAFYNHNLTSITLPSSLTSLEVDSFKTSGPNPLVTVIFDGGNTSRFDDKWNDIGFENATKS